MAPMKIQPIDIDPERVKEVRTEPVSKWRLRRLFAFERQLPKNNKDAGGGGGGTEFEPSSVCLAKMVQNFMEEQPQPQPPPPPRCGRNRCNCFNANSSDEDDFEYSGGGAESVIDSTDSLKVNSIQYRNNLNFLIGKIISI